MPTDLTARLDASRQELLDLGLRNPLLNLRPSPARGVTIVGEESAAVYELLVRQGKTMYFLAAPEARKATSSSPAINSGEEAVAETAASAAEAAASSGALSSVGGAPTAHMALAEPTPTELPEAERQALLIDNKLQTAEPLAKLESRLLNTYYTARTSLEEQGVNILYLALGQLIWYENAGSAAPRQAPLVLVPVLLERGTAVERFRLRHTGAEVEGNLSLQAKLRASFGLSLPLPEPDEETGVAGYLAAVATAVAGRPRWQVTPDAIALGFFSFGKFLLYRDLDPALWPADAPLLDHPAIAALLGTDTGFPDAPPTTGDAAFLDIESPAHELHQVLDADSSQLLALLAVHEGRNLVVQGPPGTGKSQTIANLLAEAIGAGKKVLFVAEKMAALEVVKRRLDTLGLGAACLELHSHKANKKALHDELRATLSLGRPAPAPAVEDQMAQLPRYRAALNAYALAVNAPIARSRRTAQQVVGELLRLRAERGPVELPRLPFPQLAEWTDADAAHAESLAARLQATLQKTGVPQRLLFWGSELTVLLPAEQDALPGQLHEASVAVIKLQEAAQALAGHLGLPVPPDRAAAEKLLPAARHAQSAPLLTEAAVSDASWQQQAACLTEMLQAGAAYTALHQQHDATLLPEAWSQQLLPERAALLSYGNKWWKFLIGDYRRARQRLQRLWRDELPKDAAALVPVIDAIHEAARHAQTLTEATPLGQQLFGPAWQGVRSAWPALTKTQEYLTLTHQRISLGELPAALLKYLEKGAATSHPLSLPEGSNPGYAKRIGTDFLALVPLDDLQTEADATPEEQPLAERLVALETALARQRTTLQTVAEALRLNEPRRFGPEGRLQFQSFEQQRTTLAAWAADVSALRLTTEWNNVAATVQADGLPELLTLAERWEPAAQLLTAAVRQTWLEFLQKQAYEQHPALRQFERASHEETAAHFRQADLDSLRHNRVRAMRRHFEQLPNPQAGGQMLLLRNEFAKKTRHLPLRRLMEQAGRAVQAIKPVFMMSPLSVAGFLPPGAVEFDLVVFDEASQVKPVDALGAIARGRQLVVVGDSKQLPPTSFFDSLTGSGEEADEENVTADIPSILELCKARRMPERMLRWHYRSRHQSLIAASNHLFYEDKLVIFPSPGGQQQLGLVYHHLPATYYERGSTRTNPLEARAVAEAVLHHARTTPRLTLGVVAFSTAQRQAIQDALETLRKQHPETEAFFNRHAHEPFFVKNLENVQGDERDVMFISIGYGHTKDGHLTMSFGPLNGEGGERRLNVLITRAKQRCEIFTNLTAADLDLSRTRAQGVAALKTFLDFAQHGRLNHHEEAGRAVESPFEEAVYRALTARGYQVRPQVGSQGFYIDLAVVDPGQPGHYVLGIECDGAMYHAARSARDRDRLRQQVLEAVGWRLHRIWSIDWFRDPERETARAVQAIEEAHRAALEEPDEPEEAAPVESAAKPVGILREEAPATPVMVAEPYQVAQLPATVGHRELHQHSLGQLANWLTAIVRVESPIHMEEATRRLALASGATQVGARIRKTGQDAALLAQNLRHLRRQGDFLWENTMRQPPLRDRSNLPAISRKLIYIAPEELARALRTVIEQSFVLPREAAYLPTVRLLGFSRLSDDMRQQLDTVLAGLLERHEIEEVNGVLRGLTP
jgi:very-short-patch-repair endonuclease